MLGSGAELDAAKPGERDESIPYGSYRLKIHAQPKQYLTLGGYSFDYSTRVLVNGSEVLEIGKVGASAAESEPDVYKRQIIMTHSGGRKTEPHSSILSTEVCPEGR